MIGHKNNLLGIGAIHEIEGVVIINPYGEMGELNCEKIYDVTKLNKKEKQILMYPTYQTIVDNLKFIRENKPIIYLTPSQKKEIDFLKSFFEIKTINFNKELFVDWIKFPTSDINEIERVSKSNNLAKCIYIYLTLFEKYGLLLNPNMFNGSEKIDKYLFKDINTLEKISKIDDFKILKKIINNFSQCDLTSDFIHELLFLICSQDTSERRDAIFELAKNSPKEKILLNFDEKITKELIENDGYIKQYNENEYLINF